MPRLFDPIERVRGSGSRRAEHRQKRADDVRWRLKQAALENPGMFGEVPGSAVLDELPEADQDFLGQTFYIESDNELAPSRVVQLQRSGSGGFSWKEMLNEDGKWNAPFLIEFGSEGLTNGLFGDLREVVVNSNGDAVYVSSDDRIQKFDANGTFDAVIATVGTGNGQVDTPWGLNTFHFLSFGVIVNTLNIADSGNNRFQQFADDVFAFKTGTLGSGNQNLNSPRGVVQSRATNRIYVVDTGNNRIQMIGVGSPDFVLRWGTLGSDPGEFNTPTGIVCDVAGRVWIVDTGNHRIQVFDKDGNFLFSIGSLGTGQGQFNTPLSIDIDKLGNTYVTDSVNNRIQIFDSNGVFRGQFGEYGDGDGQFKIPTGIAITDDYIYIADSGNHRIQIFQNPASGAGDSGMKIIFTDIFSGVSSYSVNDVFDGSYRNYLLKINITAAMSANADLYFRMRVAGSDNIANLYRYDLGLQNDGTFSGVGGLSTVAVLASSFAASTLNQVSCTLNVEAPALAVFTQGYSLTQNGRTDGVAYPSFTGFQHASATAFDGFTIRPSSGTITGQVSVYGWQE